MLWPGCDGRRTSAISTARDEPMITGCAHRQRASRVHAPCCVGDVMSLLCVAALVGHNCVLAPVAGVAWQRACVAEVRIGSFQPGIHACSLRAMGRWLCFQLLGAFRLNRRQCNVNGVSDSPDLASLLHCIVGSGKECRNQRMYAVVPHAYHTVPTLYPHGMCPLCTKWSSPNAVGHDHAFAAPLYSVGAK
jgi:hypothetical protein